MKRGMVDGDTALRHYLFQITQAQGISQISANALSNHIDRVMQAFKGFLEQGYGQEKLQKKQYVTRLFFNATEPLKMNQRRLLDTYTDE